MPSTAAPTTCPVAHHLPPVDGMDGLEADELLVLPQHRRMVVQYHTDTDGTLELRLFYGNKEISFDEPELFAFGETLARQSRFVAGAAASWAQGCGWSRVQPLLAQLINEGVLHRAADHPEAAPAAVGDGGARPSPLPPAPCSVARSWVDCEAITAELTGQALELGWLELVVPVFRVAHVALDGDGRQVGEANVFPRALRLDAPTSWRSCIYPGTRYQVDRPMNVTALKAMRQHWGQMMLALQRVRGAYLRRFPEARQRWTVGHLERLSTAVLALPSYQLMRKNKPVANGELHPALSCLFRVTDGLRMTMHQMLFVPIGEPTLAPDMPMDAATILAYAERNYSFHSEHGVCAGPQSMIEEFLAVLVDGKAPKEDAPVALDREVRIALEDLEAAFDYALLGLQAYAAVFSLWPAMTRTWERLPALAQAWGDAATPALSAWRERLGQQMQVLQGSTYLGTEGLRADREAVFADMHAQCALGLAGNRRTPPLRELVLACRGAVPEAARAALLALLQKRFGSGAAPAAERLCETLMDFFLQEQALLRVAAEVQGRINGLLGRSAPKRPFGAVEVDLHNRLQGAERRMPDLVEDLQQVLGARIRIDTESLQITEQDLDVLA